MLEFIQFLARPWPLITIPLGGIKESAPESSVTVFPSTMASAPNSFVFVLGP